MSANYPTSLDDNSTLPSDIAADDTTAGVPHNSVHNNADAAIRALEAKVGIGASTPPGGNKVLTSTSNGVTSWETPTGGGGGSGTVESVSSGDEIYVDNTDPANPVVNVGTDPAAKNPNMSINMGGDQQGNQTYNPTQNAIDFARHLQDASSTRIRASLPSFNNATGVSNMRAYVLAAKAAGLDPSYGVTALTGVQNDTNYNLWLADVPVQAAWADANGINWFHIGNEEDWQAQIGAYGTKTGDQVRTDVLALAVTLKAAYPDMEIIYTSAQGTVSQWNSKGTGVLDKLGFNMYDTLANFKLNIPYFMNQIGTKYFVSEWASEAPYTEMITNRGYTSQDYSDDLEERAAFLANLGLESYFFALGYSNNGSSIDDWNIRLANNTFHPGYDYIFAPGVASPTNIKTKGANQTIVGNMVITRNDGDSSGILQLKNEGADAVFSVNADTAHGVFVSFNCPGLNGQYALLEGGSSNNRWGIGNFATDGLQLYTNNGGGRTRRLSIDKNTGEVTVVNGIKKRVTSVTSSATPTLVATTTDILKVTAAAVNMVFAAPTGTPTDGQRIELWVKDDGSARTTGFNAIFRFSASITAPTTTVVGEKLKLEFEYDLDDTKWDIVRKISY